MSERKQRPDNSAALQSKYQKQAHERLEEKRLLETKNLLSKSAILLGQVKHHSKEVREPETAHMIMTDDNDPVQDIIDRHQQIQLNAQKTLSNEQLERKRAEDREEITPTNLATAVADTVTKVRFANPTGDAERILALTNPQ